MSLQKFFPMRRKTLWISLFTVVALLAAAGIFVHRQFYGNCVRLTHDEVILLQKFVPKQDMTRKRH